MSLWKYYFYSCLLQFYWPPLQLLTSLKKNRITALEINSFASSGNLIHGRWCDDHTISYQQPAFIQYFITGHISLAIAIRECYVRNLTILPINRIIPILWKLVSYLNLPVCWLLLWYWLCTCCLNQKQGNTKKIIRDLIASSLYETIRSLITNYLL